MIEQSGYEWPESIVLCGERVRVHWYTMSHQSVREGVAKPGGAYGERVRVHYDYTVRTSCTWRGSETALEGAGRRRVCSLRQATRIVAVGVGTY